MILTDEINLAHVLAEVKAVFDRYETALVSNNIEMLDQFFWHSELVVRIGVSENLYGIEAVRAFRQARSSTALKRTLSHTMITTYGADLATATTEFTRENQAAGRQSQTWVRFADGWRIVTAHVSLINKAA